MNIRGYNPVWSFVDLTGNQLDDTCFMFVLQNDLPYLPATVFHTPSGTPWTQPIQFLANGTLPVDVYWSDDPNATYRLEIRQGDTMADPLIYLIENYSPTDGSGSLSLVALPTDNQITNPQFALIDFVSPLAITNGTTETINIGPGWDLLLDGGASVGTAIITRVPKNNTDTPADTTNAPYALQLVLAGWSTATLRQRFQQNGVLWAGKTVINNVTGKLGSTGAATISASLVDSFGDTLATLISNESLLSSYKEFQGSQSITGTSDNTDVPPSAYVDYLVTIPGDCNILLTSFQIIVTSGNPLPVAYEQTTVDRQIDHTFHTYRDSLLLEAKGDILTGWDFGLNPWQDRTTTQTNVTNNVYTADQTIVLQQGYITDGSSASTAVNVSAGRASHTLNYGLTIQAVTATNQFAILQYIDPATCRPYWGGILSSYAKLTARKQNNATLRMKAKLIYRSSLPSTVSRTVPIATWDALGEPVLSAGWSSVDAINDPVYRLVDGVNELYFDGFDLTSVPSDNANMTMGLLVYTLDPMIESGALPDNITFNKVNLIPNRYASDSVSLTFDEALARCEYYYRKSFPIATLPANNTGASGVIGGTQYALASTPNANAIAYDFPRIMRAAPTVTFYNFTSGAAGQMVDVNTGASWSATISSNVSTRGFSVVGTSPAASSRGDSTAVHYVANSRLGK